MNQERADAAVDDVLLDLRADVSRAEHHAASATASERTAQSLPCLCDVVRHVVHNVHVQVVGGAGEHLSKRLRNDAESGEPFEVTTCKSRCASPVCKERSSSFGSPTRSWRRMPWPPAAAANVSGSTMRARESSEQEKPEPGSVSHQIVLALLGVDARACKLPVVGVDAVARHRGFHGDKRIGGHLSLSAHVIANRPMQTAALLSVPDDPGRGCRCGS